MIVGDSRFASSENVLDESGCTGRKHVCATGARP